MQVHRLIVVAALLLPQAAWSNYDPERIKSAISKKADLFALEGWQQNTDTASWTARTTQKWLAISIGSKRTELVTPYLNPQQIKVSKARCLEIAASGLAMETEEDRTTLSQLIDESSQHHRLAYLELNGVRFEVTPRLVGAFVRLFCTIKLTN